MRTAPAILITATVMMLCTIRVAAQERPGPERPWADEKFFTAGYTLGFNLNSFKIFQSEQHTLTDSVFPSQGSLYPGINIHLILNFRLNQFFDVRLLPGVSFSQRNINYTSTRVHDKVFSPQKVESSFLELPLQLRYGWRMQDIKPYLVGGLNYRYDFYAQEKYRIERPVYVRLNRPDIYYEAGAGMGLYLKGIRLSVELKMSNGILDVLAHDPHPDYPEYSNTIERLKSRMWLLSFHFE